MINKLPHITEGLDLAAMGLRYNGYQEGYMDVPGGHLYTKLILSIDGLKTIMPQTTFMVRDGTTLISAYLKLLIGLIDPFIAEVDDTHANPR
jgi:hypothetical protein